VFKPLFSFVTCRTLRSRQLMPTAAQSFLQQIPMLTGLR